MDEKIKKEGIKQEVMDLTPEIVSQWLGEKEMEIKICKYLIKQLKEENKRLQSALTEK